MDSAEMAGYLRGMTDQLAEMLISEPFKTDSGLKIGAALVEAHFTNPRTLSRTVGILHSRLLSDLEAEFD
ncbi:MAG: hypothetical protein ACRDT8_03685, partial [Micromonosporaceae bacterium]